MNYLNATTKYFLLLLLFVLMSNLNIAQNFRSLKSDKMKATLENYEHSLNSDNHGVRLCTVEYVGRYKISTFENNLINMLHDEQKMIDKKIIALSLSQLGSLKSMTEIKNSIQLTDNDSYREFCKSLLDNYGEYDKLRSEYFENLLISLLETE